VIDLDGLGISGRRSSYGELALRETAVVSEGSVTQRLRT
jgi:hypothetical protein